MDDFLRGIHMRVLILKQKKLKLCFENADFPIEFNNALNRRLISIPKLDCKNSMPKKFVHFRHERNFRCACLSLVDCELCDLKMCLYCFLCARERLCVLPLLFVEKAFARSQFHLLKCSLFMRCFEFWWQQSQPVRFFSCSYSLLMKLFRFSFGSDGFHYNTNNNNQWVCLSLEACPNHCREELYWFQMKMQSARYSSIDTINDDGTVSHSGYYLLKRNFNIQIELNILLFQFYTLY